VWTPAKLDEAALSLPLAQTRSVEDASGGFRIWPGSSVEDKLGVLAAFSLEYDIFLRVAFRSSAASWETSGTREVTECRWPERGGGA
jgi:hypothetical protein